MANTFAPFGFRSFGHRDGMAPTMGLDRRFIISSDTSVIGTGDPVANSSAAGGPFVTLPTTGTAAIIAGIFAGCEYFSASVGKVVWSPYFPGAVGANATVGPVTAWIISDPEMQFIAQGSTNAVVGSSLVGLNIGYSSTSAGAPNTLTGISAACLLSSAVGLNSSYPFRVVDVYSNFAPPGVNGTDNTVAGAILVVAPNNWDRKTLVGSNST